MGIPLIAHAVVLGGSVAGSLAAGVLSPSGERVTVVDRDDLFGLGEHVRSGPPTPRAFFRDLSRLIDAPWDISAGTDLGFPGVVGRRSARCGWAISTPPACRRQRLTTAC
ncbi:hypothetical protein ACLQ26_06910 [Micromonospora sp. DT43]|uniref:hypothetical protein n=1 Tax=Micromonospora sp. DT43 TaxID=3393440 RepID=UPI003CEBC82D